jgi:hypothetical protein
MKGLDLGIGHGIMTQYNVLPRVYALVYIRLTWPSRGRSMYAFLGGGRGQRNSGKMILDDFDGEHQHDGFVFTRRHWIHRFWLFTTLGYGMEISNCQYKPGLP